MKKLIILVLFSLSTIFIYSQVTNGLVGHFSFIYGSFTDESGYQDCVLSYTGDSTFYLAEDRFENSEYAIDFQGAVLDAGSISRDITDEVTVSLWMKTEESPEDVKFLINKYYCVEPPLGYHLAFMGDSVTFDGRDNSSNGYMRSGWSVTKINDGMWHHVVGLVKSEGTWEIWINAVKESSNSYSPIVSLNHSSCHLGIAGRHSGDEIRIYHGILDDIRIYNRALDSLEIDSLFNENNPVTGLSKNRNNQEIKIISSPNPFTTSTKIEYTLNSPQIVTITFYNQFGKQVDVIKEHQMKGLNEQIWTPANIADGIYFFTLNAGEKITSGKLVIMK